VFKKIVTWIKSFLFCFVWYVISCGKSIVVIGDAITNKKKYVHTVRVPIGILLKEGIFILASTRMPMCTLWYHLTSWKHQEHGCCIKWYQTLIRYSSCSYLSTRGEIGHDHNLHRSHHAHLRPEYSIPIASFILAYTPFQCTQTLHLVGTVFALPLNLYMS
jgi:hypothetical protein